MLELKWTSGHESTIEPAEVDTTSSPTTVYLHRNIETEERTNMNSDKEETVTMYVYDEAKLTVAEYAQYLKEMNDVTLQTIMQRLEEMELSNAELITSMTSN